METVRIKCSTASERARAQKERLENKLVALCDKGMIAAANNIATTTERTCGHRRMQITVYRAS